MRRIWVGIVAENNATRRESGVPYAKLAPDAQAALAAQLRPRIRDNTFDAKTGQITVSDDRAAAIAAVTDHYTALFGDDPQLRSLRKAYAMKEATVLGGDNRSALSAFIWWSSWSAVTNRPGQHISYTNNWPMTSWSATRRRRRCGCGRRSRSVAARRKPRR